MAKADAPVMDAPLQKEGKNTFLPQYKFDVNKRYVFELAEENPTRELPVIDMVTKREAPHKKFKPWQNIILTSQIVWKGERRTLRYYDGCTTLFVDEQPKDEKAIEQYIKQSKKRVFVDGKFSVFGDERMLLIYLTICSWNADSPFRTRTAQTIFVAQNPDKVATIESEKLDKIEEALKYAREATDVKMFIHGNFLGIPRTDWDSDNELTPKEYRTKYRQEASRNPIRFIESYGNRSIEVKYYIDKALEKGIINNKFNPNKATWGSNNTVICDISGLKSNEAISQAIFEFSKSEEGEEFVIQLKAISEV
jgi:outer membrane lipoprotein-sorting protein